MARSSKQQMTVNRQRIVAAAGELFRSHGYDAVAIADVMQAAGMTQGGFYKHFASKEALACEAWKMGFTMVESVWRPASGDQAGGDSPSIPAIVDYYLSVRPPEDRCPMQAHGEDSARSDDGGALRSVFAEGAGALCRTFTTKAGEAMDEDDARLLFAAMVGASMLGRASGGADWSEEIKRSVRDAAQSVTGRSSL